MHRFSATTVSEAVVAAPREDIWAAITDPTVLPKLTPLLRHIEADGDLWRWDLSRINVLGIVVDPSFTERMSFVPNERIEYTHEPPAGAHEWASAEGWYQLTRPPRRDPSGHLDHPLGGAAPRAPRRARRGDGDPDVDGGDRVTLRQQPRPAPRHQKRNTARLT